MQTPFSYSLLGRPGGIDRMSDVYSALRRTVRTFGPISNPAVAIRNARREQHELARLIAQVDALEQRLARQPQSARAAQSILPVREPRAGRAA